MSKGAEPSSCQARSRGMKEAWSCEYTAYSRRRAAAVHSSVPAFYEGRGAVIEAHKPALGRRVAAGCPSPGPWPLSQSVSNPGLQSSIRHLHSLIPVPCRNGFSSKMPKAEVQETAGLLPGSAREVPPRKHFASVFLAEQPDRDAKRRLGETIATVHQGQA
jgi:hypothetical protein